ncbi:alpha/beta fold hydrolase [Methylorubrum sp. SL192]|uniref:alpha/beta fold hydrolase n=1 Tax=Methylorubrum sp. SL192 TaxID=2995167 RepID=UPI002274667F|nr:alpha/beta hydrolase [Methylorubrum sp. SL192]MCY1643471.1 alpha/beta hydrolase [Methylorubrum sp. SL192]
MPLRWIVVTAGAILVRLALVNSLARRRAGQEHSQRPGRLAARHTRVNGRTMHARVSVDPVPDDSLPVILVHGLGMSSRYMIPLARQLALYRRVYAPDLPGFGLSDKPPHVLTVRELADALAAWMDAIGIDRAAFIGNSLGCEVLVELALVHPQRVDRLVLQGPTPDPESRGLVRQVVGFFAIAPFERWSLAWVALADYARGGIKRYILTLRSMVGNRIGEKVLRVTQPTLVVWGTRDYIVPYAFVTSLAAALPRGRLAVIPGAAHGINYSHPKAFVSALLPFLLATGHRPRDVRREARHRETHPSGTA